MFKNLSEDITFLMIKNKILDIESYDIYVYSIEVILLNGSILLSCFLISVLFGELFHWLAFILFFIPLRVFAGGFHCEKSEMCFLGSIGMYVLSILWVEYTGDLYIKLITQIIAAISIILVLIFSPLINPNHPLKHYQVNRNKKIIYGIIAVDFVLYAIFYCFDLIMAQSEVIFIILVASTLILGILVSKRKAGR